MKKQAISMLAAGLLLSGCGSLGNTAGRINVGVAVSDAGSEQVASLTITPEKCDDKGVCTPEKRDVTIAEGQPVTFTFSTRPGSDAVTIEGYRILSDRLDGVERVNSSNPPKNAKMNLYVPSGYSCDGQAEGSSCVGTETNLVPTNGEAVEHQIYFASGLGAVAASKGASVSRVVDIEFYGFSANNVPFTKLVSGVVSRGTLIVKTN